MMKLQSVVVFSILCGLQASAVSRADGSVEEGQSKSTPCIACHGMNGNSSNPVWPNLAAQHKQYIERQLKAFKAGTRQDPLMSPMAMSLSDDDVQDLAAFFDAQTLTGLEADAGRAPLGQRVYRGGDSSSGVAACIACHGPGGDGNPAAGYPSIKGQHSAYVAAQLRAYRAGTRKTDPNQMMRDVTRTMSDEQIDAVAAFIQGMR
jgi:cytochrome c553